MFAVVVELNAGSGYEVFDGARDEYLPGAREGSDAGADVYGQPADMTTIELAFAGMDASANLDSELADKVGDRSRASDRTSWPVEGGQEAVSRGVDLLSPEPCELCADKTVVAADQGGPRSISALSGGGGGFDEYERITKTTTQAATAA